MRIWWQFENHLSIKRNRPSTINNYILIHFYLLRWISLPRPLTNVAILNPTMAKWQLCSLWPWTELLNECLLLRPLVASAAMAAAASATLEVGSWPRLCLKPIVIWWWHRLPLWPRLTKPTTLRKIVLIWLLRPRWPRKYPPPTRPPVCFIAWKPRYETGKQSASFKSQPLLLYSDGFFYKIASGACSNYDLKEKEKMMASIV